MGSIFSSLEHFQKTGEFFSLSNGDNLSSKQIAENAAFSGCKNGEPVQNTLDDINDINDSRPHILTTLKTENTLTDDLLHASTPGIEKFTVKDSLPWKWTKKDISVAQQEKIGFENTQATIDVDLAPHKLFELFLDDEVINYLSEQSKICTNSRGNFTFHANSDELHGFLAILLSSGYISLPHHQIYWEQAPDILNCPVSDLLTRSRFEEMLKYLHLADNVK